MSKHSISLQDVKTCTQPELEDGTQAVIVPPACPPAPAPALVSEMPVCEAEPAPLELPKPVFFSECLPCDWEAVKNRSMPPALQCPTIISGWGAYDGGILDWAGHLADACQLARGDIIQYFQTDWASTLDLVSHGLHHTELMVRADGSPRLINEMEFRTLAVRLSMLGVLAGVVAPATAVPSPDSIELAVTVDEASGAAFLHVAYDGKAVGKGLQLAQAADATGKVIGYLIPA